jgi:hypoxanthine-guanine phosphoribosyltransferase
LVINIEKDKVRDKDILVIEDIYDSGSTIDSIHELLKKFEAKSVKFAIIFHKKNPLNLKYKFYAEYTGFVIPL